MPPSTHFGGVGRHGGCVAREPLAVKRGLNDAALCAVQRLFAGQQAVSHDGTPTLHDRTAHVFGCMSDEKLVDEVRMVQQKCMFPAKTKMCDIAIIRSKVLQESNRITAKIQYT